MGWMKHDPDALEYFSSTPCNCFWCNNEPSVKVEKVEVNRVGDKIYVLIYLSNGELEPVEITDKLKQSTARGVSDDELPF